MNYYEHHIGDYAAATAHLSLLEDAIYSRLLRRYYLQEEPLPGDLKQVTRLAGARTPDEVEAVEVVLAEFFVLQLDGWHNKRADEEIERYQDKQDKARASANARWSKDAKPSKSDRNANAMRPHSEGNAHQTPDTSNQEEPQEQQHVQPLAARCRFADFWAAYPNKKGKQEAEKTWKRRKLDGQCDQLITHVLLMAAEDSDWARGYVPMGSTYLNQARWEDVPKLPPRAGPHSGAGPPQASKTLTAIQKLQGMKHGNLDQQRNSGRAEQAALPGPGPDAGLGFDRGYGRNVG
jgi:uncharacterized protein YdaU (DUF1376 family)